MGKVICAVPNCLSSNKTYKKYTFFGIPKKDETIRELWSKILECSLNKSSVICEKHFDKDAFTDSNYYAATKDGKVLLNVPKQRKMLKKGANPKPNKNTENIIHSISNYSPKASVITPSKNTDNNTTCLNICSQDENLVDPQVKSTNDNASLRNCSQDEDFINIQSTPKRKKKDFQPESQKNSNFDKILTAGFSHNVNRLGTEKENLIKESLLLECQDNLKDITATPVKKAFVTQSTTPVTPVEIFNNGNDAMNDSDKYINLIASVYQGSCVIQLPSDEWKFIRGRENCIAFCKIQSYHEVAENLTSKNPTFLHADITKQVSLNAEKLELKLRYKLLTENDNLHPKKKPNNKEELELFLRHVDSYRMCLGGPTLNYYRTTVLDCARKDPPVWRHIDCELVLSNNGQVCYKCLSLHTRFGQTINKRIRRNLKTFMMTGQKSSQKLKKCQVENIRIKKNTTPQTRAMMQELKMQRNAARKRLKRAEHTISTLKKNLEKLPNKMIQAHMAIPIKE